MQITEGKKIYFSSDNHLGAPTPEASMPREKKFVRWLDTVKEDAAAIYLLGDYLIFGSNIRLLSLKDLFGCWESWPK